MRPISLLLLLAACAPVSDGAPKARENTANPWTTALGQRIAVAETAAQLGVDGLVVDLPARGVHVSFDTDGATAASGSGSLSVRLSGMSRDGATEFAPVEPALGASVAGLTAPDGVASHRVEYVHPGLTEWYAGTPEGLDHGWTVDDRPAGQGRVRFELETDAAVYALADDEVELVDPNGGTWSYAGLAAWDATGRPLDARFVDGEKLRIDLDDSGAVYPIEIDPVLTTADTTLTGPSANSYFGYALANAGDVNGDGYEDVIVGAYKVSGNTGRAYVYHGSATGLSTTATSTLSGGNSSGSTPYYYCGGRVAGGADVNADGYDDVVMACTFTTAAAKVFLGSASGVSTTANASVSGNNATLYGYGLALVPSVDGDAYADLVVGAPGHSSYRGRLYWYQGGATGLDTHSNTIDGSASSYFGTVAHAAGDVNGDGYNDVVVSSPAYSAAAGRASVYYGSATGLTSGSVTNLNGTALSAFGTGLAGGGDVNGDGYDDIAVGTYSATSTATTYAYVFHGSSAGIAAAASTTLSGTNAFGTTMAILPDMDADGYADLAVGAATGLAVSVYRGSAAGISTTAAETVSESGTYFGFALDGSDVDGDGYTDLVVGDYADSSTYGKVYTYGGYADDDGDGYGGGGADNTDCDDTDANTYPGAPEVIGDGIDEDCDGLETCLADGDDDGYLDGSGTTVASVDGDCTDAGEGTTSDPATDCDDGDAAIHPGATELPGDSVDQDCSGTELCFDDDDGDGTLDTTGDTRASADLACTGANEGSDTTATTDCDDTDPTVHVGATEVVGDEVDSNCDGAEVCFADADHDGYASTDTVVSADATCAAAGEASLTDPSGDCDDTDAGVSPGDVEVCAGGLVDEDCDGTVNEADAVDASTWYADLDGDGFGDVTSTVTACTAPVGYVSDATDCDDGDATIYPGAPEVCGGGDSNCNGLVDGADPDATGLQTWYTDADGDTYGDAASAVLSCDAPVGTVADATDCDDTDAAVHPGAPETAADGVDGNCDGSENCYADTDGDGARTSATVSSADLDCSDPGEATAAVASDCDDGDASVHPGATESVGDGVDEDCDTFEDCYVDDDADSYRTDATISSTNLACDGVGEADSTVTSGDCDDADASIHPGAYEETGDGVDQDCDGTEYCYVDVDDDGYREPDTSETLSSDSDCDDPGEALVGDPTGDCDDADAAFHPGASETDCTDPNDYNCDGSVGTADVDGDGYAACVECDDADADVHPGAAETVGDGVDSDCDGEETCYADQDGDGHRPDATATVPSSDSDCTDVGEADASVATDDCDDNAAAIHPGATEVVADGVDQDCDGGEICYADADNDGYRNEDDTLVVSADDDCTNSGEAGVDDPTGDCDDSSAAYHPGATEDDCTDPNDYNCDGSSGAVDGDGDGYAACEECDDAHANVNPGAAEVCNGLDDDCSGAIDDAPVDGVTQYADNDGDGYGDPNAPIEVCDGAAGSVADNTDCDDAAAGVHPGAPEVGGDGVDQDCDGADGTLDDTGGDTAVTDTGREGGAFGGCGCDTGGAGAGVLAVGGVVMLAGLRRRRPAS